MQNQSEPIEGLSMWRLLETGLNDLHAAYKDPSYIIDMGEWHRPLLPGQDGTCRACLAGAVMAMSLGTPRSQMVIPEFFCDDPGVPEALHALDYMRMGNLGDAFAARQMPIPSLTYWETPTYSDVDHDMYIVDMLDLVDFLYVREERK